MLKWIIRVENQSNWKRSVETVAIDVGLAAKGGVGGMPLREPVFLLEGCSSEMESGG